MKARVTTRAQALDREETDSETLTQILAILDKEVLKETVPEAT
jgi:hypothetical protein